MMMIIDPITKFLGDMHYGNRPLEMIKSTKIMEDQNDGHHPVYITLRSYAQTEKQRREYGQEKAAKDPATFLDDTWAPPYSKDQPSAAGQPPHSHQSQSETGGSKRIHSEERPSQRKSPKREDDDEEVQAVTSDSEDSADKSTSDNEKCALRLKILRLRGDRSRPARERRKAKRELRRARDGIPIKDVSGKKTNLRTYYESITDRYDRDALWRSQQERQGNNREYMQYLDKLATSKVVEHTMKRDARTRKYEGKARVVSDWQGSDGETMPKKDNPRMPAYLAAAANKNTPSKSKGDSKGSYSSASSSGLQNRTSSSSYEKGKGKRPYDNSQSWSEWQQNWWNRGSWNDTSQQWWYHY